MDFLGLVCNDLITRIGFEHLRDYTVVFPMNRATLFMREKMRVAIRERYGKPCLAPEFTTISGLVDELSSLHSEDEILSVSRLYTIFKEETQSTMSMDVFYNWGRQLLQDFSNVDMALVDADALFSNSVYAHTLEADNLPEETKARLQELLGRHALSEERISLKDSYQQDFEQLWQHLPAIYHRFIQQQSQDGVGSSGARLRQVVEHINDLDLSERHFVFVGFNYLLKGEKALMLSLKDRSLFYWDYNPTFHTNKDVYRFIRQHIADGLTNSTPAEDTTTDLQPLTLMVTAGNNAQAQYVHEWLPGKKGPTAVVIADEGMLEPVIYALPDSVAEHVNITKGYPLRNTQVFYKITKYLMDPKNDKEAEELNYAGVLERLLEYINPSPADPLLVEEPENNEPLPPKDWQQLLTEESLYQATKVINHYIRLMKQGVLDQIEDLKTLRNLLRRHLESLSLPFHGEPVTDIQVMGVLETRVLDFKHLLILNVEEGVVPQKKQDISFIPYYLRKYYGLETNDESAAAYAYNFFRLLRRAEDVTILFSEATTALGKKSMSRFLMQILTSNEFKVTKKRLTESCQIHDKAVQLIDLERKSLLDKWEKEQTQNRHLSPSAINTYLDCKMRFYLQHILELTEEPTPSPILAANEMGSLIHSTIYSAYRYLCPSLPANVSADAIADFLNHEERMQQALTDGYALMNRDYNKHHEEKEHYKQQEHVVENIVALSHLRKVLTNDMETIQNEGELTLVMMEDNCYTPVSVLTNHGTIVSVAVGGIVDRLDRIQGTTRIIDYKTGAYDAKKMAVASIQDLFDSDKTQRYVLQLLTYCLAAHQTKQSFGPIMPGLLFTGKNLHSFDPHLSVNKTQITDFEQQCQTEFAAGLKELVSEIVNNESFPKKESKNCSETCPFRHLCY